MNSNSPASRPSTKLRTRCSWSTEERIEWIALLERSGQSLSEFCRTNDLPESTVSLWRKQLRGPQATLTEAGALLEVPTALAASLTPCTESNVISIVVIRLPGEITLEAAAGTDVAWLGALIRTLRSA